MIKILFVLNHFRYSNGVAAALFNLIKNLPTRKYDIHVLAVYEFDPEFAKPIQDKITIVPGFNKYFRGFDKIVRCIPGQILHRYFIREKYDIEIAFQFGIPTVMVAEGNNLNRICWMHGYDNEMRLRRYYNRYRRIVSVSQVGRDKLLKDGFPLSQIDYCYNVIDEERINCLASEEISIFTDKIVIVSVGRLSPEKGYSRYIESIVDLGLLQNKVEFWIIGDGPERDKLRSIIDLNHLDDCVKMLGMQKNPYKYIKNSDVYFCPSYHEGFSTTCQEAAILGIPVVSVDVDGANELVALAECGEVIENSKEAIFKELVKILNDDHRIHDWKEIAKRTKHRFYKNERISKAEMIIKKCIT